MNAPALFHDIATLGGGGTGGGVVVVGGGGGAGVVVVVAVVVVAGGVALGEGFELFAVTNARTDVMSRSVRPAAARRMGVLMPPSSPDRTDRAGRGGRRGAPRRRGDRSRIP